MLIVGGEPRIGVIQTVRITQAHAYDLVGEAVEGGAEAAVKAFEAGFKARKGQR